MAIDETYKKANARNFFKHWDKTASIGGSYLRGKFGNGHELHGNMKRKNKADIFIRDGKNGYHKYTAVRSKDGNIKVSKGRNVATANYKRNIVLNNHARAVMRLDRTGPIRGHSARFAKASTGRSGG